MGTARQSAYKVMNGLAPDQGPMALYMELDFSGTTAGIGSVPAVAGVIEDDIFAEESMGTIEFIQTMHVNNTRVGNVPITFRSVNGIPMDFVVPAGKQAILPFYGNSQTKYRFTLTPAANVAGLIVPVTFLNVPMATIVW